MTTYTETTYRTAEELGITDDERSRLLYAASVLLLEPEDFNVMDWKHCIAGKAGLGKSAFQMSHVIFWNLCCRQGKCWPIEDLLNHRSGSVAARAVVNFLQGSEIVDGKPEVIMNRLAR